MPTARASPMAEFVDEKLYVIGGLFERISLWQNEVYDPKTNTWKTKSPLPTPRDHATSEVLDEKIYLFGGRADYISTSMAECMADDPMVSGVNCNDGSVSD